MRIRLGSIGEISTASQDGLYSVQVLRCGSWKYPFEGESDSFDINENLIDQFIANFEAGEKGREVPVNLHHDPDQEAGWGKALFKEGTGDDPDTGAKMFARFSVDDPEVKRKVDLGLLKYASSELDFEWVNPEKCQTNGDCTPKPVFEGLALTNRPYIKGMAPISLGESLHLSIESSQPGGCKCGGKCRKSKLQEAGMPATLEEANTAIADLEAKLAEAVKNNKSTAALSDLEVKLETEKAARLATEQRMRDMEVSTKLSEATTRIEKLVRKRHITPFVGRMALRLAELAYKGGIGSVQLTEKVKVKKVLLAEGEKEGAFEDVDKLDVVGEVLDMLQEMPDALSTHDDDEVELDEGEDAPSGEDDKEAEAVKCADEAWAKDKTKPYRTHLSEAYKKFGIENVRRNGMGGR